VKQFSIEIFALALATSIATILIDHQVKFSLGPYLVLVNVIPAVLFAFALYGMTARVFFSFLAAAIFQALIIVADIQKNRILHSHLAYADIKLVPMLLQDPHLVVGFVAKTGPLLAGSLIALLALCGAWKIWKAKIPLLLRVATTGLATLLLVAVSANETTIPLPNQGWNPFQQTTEAKNFGVTANLLFGARNATTIAIHSDSVAVKDFYDEPRIRNAIAEMAPATTLRPDIILVQSESLFEPSALCGMPDEPILSAIANSHPSQLHVPVFGGRTLQTEFEVISGVPTVLFPGNQFAYFDLLKKPIAALPEALSELGYRTIAIHPNQRDFWRRGFAIPALGFEHFIDETAFSDRDVGAYGSVSDQSLITAALSELSATNQPAMIFLITMQNHGPWGTSSKDPDHELTDYVQRAKAADSTWKELITALSKRGKPAIAAIYGDHLPGLTETYAKHCFKDGRAPEMHWPPLAIWSNFKIPSLPYDMESYQLAGWLMEAAQLPMTPYFRANAAMRRATSARDNKSKHILHEYGSIAAKMLLTSITRQNTPNVTLDQTDIGKLLPKILSEGLINPYVKQDVLLDAAPLGDQAVLKLNSQVKSITFRPYTIDANCNGAQKITYLSNNQQLATGNIANSANITTVEVDDVDRLIIKRDRQNSEARCWPVTLRLVQMQCVTNECNAAETSKGQPGQK